MHFKLKPHECTVKRVSPMKVLTKCQTCVTSWPSDLFARSTRTQGRTRFGNMRSSRVIAGVSDEAMDYRVFLLEKEGVITMQLAKIFETLGETQNSQLQRGWTRTNATEAQPRKATYRQKMQLGRTPMASRSSTDRRRCGSRPSISSRESSLLPATSTNKTNSSSSSVQMRRSLT